MEKDPSKTNSLWLLMLALFGLVLAKGSITPTAPEQGGGQAKTSSERGQAIATREPELKDVSIEVHNVLGEGGFAARVLVALLPDPDPGATQVGWLFDSYVDGVQRAVQRAGYLLFRRALPLSWTVPADKLASVRSGDDPSLPAHEPGLLVFRRQNGGELLLVFLVGESPTRGIEPGAFSRVFDWLSYVDPDWASESVNAELAIVGPTFSGSAWSLARAIRAINTSDPRVGTVPEPICTVSEPETLSPAYPRSLAFRVVSGSATGPEVKGTLEKDPRVAFSRTVVPDQAVMQALYEYLSKRGVPLSKVALLVESTTEYGSAVVARHEGSEAPRVTFQFPPNLAQARVAYEQTRPARDQAATTSTESRISQIELSLDDPTKPGDVVPPLNPRTASVGIDLMLANILSTMAREDVRYGVIVATDPRDKLFLARKLREHMPDVRLLTTESSLFFTHPDYRAYLNGMILATTYPLFSKTQLWLVPERAAHPTGTTTQVAQFADASAEGVYNATLALLGSADRMKDYGTPRFGGPSSDADARRPPIWITAVGRDGMWPLAVKPEPDTDTNQVLVGGRSVSPDPPMHDLVAHVSYSRSGLTLLLLVGALAAAHAWLVIRFWPERELPRQPSAWRLLEPLRPSRDPENDLAQRTWLVCLLGTLLIVELNLLALVAVFVGSSWDGQRLIGEAIGVAILSAVAVLVPFALLIVAIVRVGGRAGWVLALGAIALAVCIPWSILSDSGPSAEWVFLYLRATNPSSGLSFAIPLLLMGAVVYLWCLHHLRRLHYCAAFDVQNPLADKSVPASKSLRQSEDEIRRIERKTVFGAVPWTVSLPTFAIASLPCISLWRSLLPGFDGRFFDLLFLVAFTVAYLAVLSACLRFVWLWVNLRTLLRQLDCHPLAGAFGRLPAALSVALRHQFYRYVPGLGDRCRWANLWLCLNGEFAELAVAAEREDELARTAPSDALRALLAGTQTAFFDQQNEEQGAARRELAGNESKAQRELTRLAAAVARMAMQRTRSELECKGAPADAMAAADRAETFVAVQVVCSLGPKFMQLGNLVEFAVLGMLLIAFAFSSYPFQPQQLLSVFTLTLAGAVLLALLVAIVQADRDPLLSRIGGTEPGRITWDRGFVTQVVTYGLLPLLTVLGTQIPAAGQLFDSLFKLIK